MKNVPQNSTTERICKLLEDSLEEIDIDKDKCSRITTESESSMIKDVQLFCVKVDSINMLTDDSLTVFQHIYCNCHKLNVCEGNFIKICSLVEEFCSLLSSSKITRKWI